MKGSAVEIPCAGNVRPPPSLAGIASGSWTERSFKSLYGSCPLPHVNNIAVQSRDSRGQQGVGGSQESQAFRI